jgi:hypothetical protein
MRALITVTRGTKGLYVRPRCFGTAWSLPSGPIHSFIHSKENPADLVSRGVDANVLRNLSLWWNGPNWLQQAETSWPKCEEIADISEEKKTVNPIPVVSLVTQSSQEELFTKFSSWNKLQ